MRKRFISQKEIKKRCVEIKQKIREACSYCMDQPYLRFLIQLARKSKQSGLSKSAKSLVKRNATQMSKLARFVYNEGHQKSREISMCNQMVTSEIRE